MEDRSRTIPQASAQEGDGKTATDLLVDKVTDSVLNTGNRLSWDDEQKISFRDAVYELIGRAENATIDWNKSTKFEVFEAITGLNTHMKRPGLSTRRMMSYGFSRTVADSALLQAAQVLANEKKGVTPKPTFKPVDPNVGRAKIEAWRKDRTDKLYSFNEPPPIHFDEVSDEDRSIGFKRNP